MMDKKLPDTHKLELYALTQMLVTTVTRMLHQRARIGMSAEPEIKLKKIVQFGQRMRVDGLEKFNQRTVLAAVRFYRDRAQMDLQNAAGCLVLYIPLSYISNLLNLLDYPRIDEEDDAAVMDGCGTIINLLAGDFIKDLTLKGYVHLEMSPFESFINTAVNGIEFSADQDNKYEINLEINQEKKLVLELTMAPIPRY